MLKTSWITRGFQRYTFWFRVRNTQNLVKFTKFSAPLICGFKKYWKPREWREVCTDSHILRRRNTQNLVNSTRFSAIFIFSFREILKTSWIPRGFQRYSYFLSGKYSNPRELHEVFSDIHIFFQGNTQTSWITRGFRRHTYVISRNTQNLVNYTRFSAIHILV
mgnify:CR=1 FL=1